MTQTIDPAKLKAAAEHLEWVLRQYPDSEDVQGMLHGLLPLIEDAKAGRIQEPIDRRDIPFAYNFGDGAYTFYRNPDVGGAYARFATEIKGGLTEQEKQLLADTDALRKEVHEGFGS